MQRTIFYPPLLNEGSQGPRPTASSLTQVEIHDSVKQMMKVGAARQMVHTGVRMPALERIHNLWVLLATFVNKNVLCFTVKRHSSD